MDLERAKEINGRLSWAYFVVEGLTDQPMPDLSDVSLADAMEATKLVRDAPHENLPDGGQRVECVLEERAIARILAAAIISPRSVEPQG